MKNIFKLMALFAFLFCFSSCEDDEPVISTLEVTPANLEGTWKLAEWNGASLDEGTYCYVIFNRKEQTFEMYQKFDSMYARYITGSFSIENNPYLGYIISGVYDYGNGDWNNKYIVTDLLESGSMTWTSKDDESDVNKYIRCENVPEEIIAEAKVDKDEELRGPSAKDSPLFNIKIILFNKKRSQLSPFPLPILQYGPIPHEWPFAGRGREFRGQWCKSLPAGEKSP